MNSRLAPAMVIALVMFGCTANPSRPASTPAANPEFKNVQVLPHDLSREQLINVMRSFTRGLGVRCDHCHVVTATEPKQVLDFPSDAKEEKRVARVMIQMTQQINAQWLERVEQAEGPEKDEPAEAAAAGPAEPRVGCWTCHRGKTEPEMPPPPPPPPAGAAPQH